MPPRAQRASPRVPRRRLCTPTSSRQKDKHKLSPPWEGQFIIHEVLRPGTYKIQYEDGRVVSNALNIEHLCLFYP
jgi:hypothetical protein